MDDARSRSARVLFTEQQTQRLVGADRAVHLERGIATVTVATDAGEVTVNLRGPAARLADLTEQAATIGFRYVVERP
jgi:hypothetical protein